MRVLVALAFVACGQQSHSPVFTTPQRLYDDFTKAHALDRYRDGATFTALVKTVGEPEPGKPLVWVEVDGDNFITLEFAPPPPPVQAGDILIVTCKIGGASGALMMVTDCTST